MKLLMIDNYDSFTFNVVQALRGLGAEVVVARNDAIDTAGAVALAPDGLVVSPGPGTPDDAGISAALIAHFGGHVPILGICLGHQTLIAVHGGRITRCERVMHGKTSPVYHDGRDLYTGLSNPLIATRYHSLGAREQDVPADLEICAYTAEGEVMRVRHRTQPSFGVQFHPESIMTVEGVQLLDNWLRLCVPAPEVTP